MYYSSGNYEAFARPRKPAGVEHKSAYIIGSGLAALSAACFLVRDGQMPGKQVHILEKDPIPGGACDGYQYSDIGYVMRGGREMDNHFECMWDLFRSIPSIETEGISVLDEYYWLNKADPNAVQRKSKDKMPILIKNLPCPIKGPKRLCIYSSHQTKIYIINVLTKFLMVKSLILISGFIGGQCLLLKIGILP